MTGFVPSLDDVSNSDDFPKVPKSSYDKKLKRIFQLLASN
jgi:hypothetical protein